MEIEEICSSAEALPLLSLNHVSFLCRSVKESVRFYEEVLGFVLIKRPSSFNFTGAWLVVLSKFPSIIYTPLAVLHESIFTCQGGTLRAWLCNCFFRGNAAERLYCGKNLQCEEFDRASHNHVLGVC